MPRKKKGQNTPPDPADPVLPAVHPAVEEQLNPQDSLPFPIVAIGASAGGLEAFKTLLGELPPRTGMAFVILQHLSPTQESMLSEILARATEMPVTPVTEDMPVEPDHVYVIAPGKDLVFGDGRLQLSPRTEVRGLHRPIDHFMRALADGQGHKAIGVVLSGTGNDGSLGIQEIKAGGGLTFAQDNTAEQPSMPRSAVATGAVDFVLPPAEIARELDRIARHPYVSPALEKGQPALSDSAMQRILGILSSATGVEFDGYKRNTLSRRIARRMVLHKLDGLQDYVRFLQANPGEIEALFHDVLINVTSFFRNPEAYEALKNVVFPAITEDRQRHDPVRIWALGCSTGEEAYSLAIAFSEYAEASGRRAPAQIFATDLNASSIEKARNAVYAKGIAQDVSPERLRRYFVDFDGSYRIAKPIRDMCIFARQNVLADPPFSRLDLVACRNMLIYLDGSAQQRMIPMLHYALRNGGYLWLGGSETIGTYRDLFDLLDAKNKIYAKKAIERPAYIPTSHRWEPSRGMPAPPANVPREPPGNDPQRDADRMLITRYAPPAVVVNDEMDILQFRGDTGTFLTPAPGRATLNILKMLREGLIVGVRNALARARKDGDSARVKDLRVRTDAGWRDVDVEVLPLKGRGGMGNAYLVVFEEPAETIAARTRQLNEEAKTNAQRSARFTGARDRDKEMGQIKQELSTTREYLQSVIEQQEAANEELQSANEEVQSANEELQSINEELETSKEEIQSANEELATVNDELQNRNHELSQSNNDLTNLLASVHMAIVMLGPDMRIRRFTPIAEKIFNLVPGDVGRPVGDVKMTLEGDDLEKVVEEVMETMSIREREVRDRQGRWYSLRVRPYRTLENRLDGAVVVLVDIDDIKRGERALRESEARFEMLANAAPVLVWMNDLEGCHFVNRAFEDFVGELESEIRNSSIARFIHPDDREEFTIAYGRAVKGGATFEARSRFRRADGEYRWMKSIGIPRFVDSRLVGYMGGTFDITDMKEAEAALLELDRGKNEFIAMLAHELRNPLSGVRNASRLLGDPADAEAVARAREIIDRQTGNMVRMIDDLLDVSRITQGKITLRREAVDLVSVVRASVDSTSADRTARSQALAATLPEAPIWIEGDSMRLDQVVSNLLNNASKFTPNGGRIWLTLEVEPTRGTATGLSAVLRVRDNGVGIDTSMLPRIFDLFVQADHADDRSRSGVGLGLTVARRLVELHEGSIEAVSAGVGQGSEFVVRLPVMSQAPTARDKPEARVRRASRPMRRMLIVDDNVDSAESMRLMFAAAGHNVEVALTGTQAIAKATQFNPDVVLLDIGLPDMDGYAVARELRAKPELRDALLIATTGYSRTRDIEKAHRAGIDDHMTKPVDLDAILERIDRER